MNGVIFANLSASVAVLLILLLRRLFKEKLFAKFFVALWLLVIIRLLLPFEFFSPMSIYSPLSEPENYSSVNKYVYYGDFSEGEKIPEGKTEASALPKAEKIKISSEEALVFIWAFGGIFVGVFFAAKHLHNAKRILKTCEPYEAPEIYKTGNTRFYKSKNLASPLSFGILRPAIVIPEETAEDQLHFVLLHEQTHIKDRDAVLKILALFALSLNWFNPLVWFTVKIFERDIERYCDERVLEKIGAEKALLYANTILDFAERQSLSFNYFSAASLCERVTSIMKTKHKKQNFFVSALVLGAVVLTITACGTLPEEAEKEPAQTEDLSGKTELIDNAINDIIEVELGNSSIAIVDVSSGEVSAVVKIDPDTGTVIAVDKEPGNIVVEIPGLDEELMGYSGEVPPNNYATETYSFPEEEIEKISVSGFSFSEYSSVNVILIPSEETKVSATYGEALRENGFCVAVIGKTLYISVGTECENLEEAFDLRIYADIENLDIEIENLGYSVYSSELKQAMAEKTESETEKTEEPSGKKEIGFEFVLPVEEGYLCAKKDSYKGHTGIDIASGNGEKGEIFAAAEGTVVEVKWYKSGYGYYMIIDHGNGVQTLYAHCSEMYVKLGQKVKAGEPIGKTGSTGNSTGTHLHFEIRINGEYVDPEIYLPTI